MTIPNDERMLVIPVFVFDDIEEGAFKRIRVRADEVIGYFPHVHEVSYGEDHVYMVHGATVEFKNFEARCTPMNVGELDYFFLSPDLLETRICYPIRCRGQEYIFDKLKEIKEYQRKNPIEEDGAELNDDAPIFNDDMGWGTNQDPCEAGD